MEKLARRSLWVNKRWGQSNEATLSSLQPLTCHRRDRSLHEVTQIPYG